MVSNIIVRDRVVRYRILGIKDSGKEIRFRPIGALTKLILHIK